MGVSGVWGRPLHTQWLPAQLPPSTKRVESSHQDVRMLQVRSIQVGYSFMVFKAIHVGMSQHQFTIEPWDFMAGLVGHVLSYCAAV